MRVLVPSIFLLIFSRKNRQHGVALVVRSINRDFIKIIRGHLHHIADIPRLLLRIKKVESSYHEWCKIHTTLQNSIRIMETILTFIAEAIESNSNPDDVFFLQSVCDSLDLSTIASIVAILDRAIDFSTPQDIGSTTVIINEGYDEILDQQKILYDNIEKHLSEAAHRVLDIVPLLETLSVEYLPQVGYLGKKINFFHRIPRDITQLM